jgi:hypothetical protein
MKNSSYTWDWYCHLVGDRASLEPFLFCLDLMDQRFHPAKNKSNKFIMFKHACFA